LRLRRRDRARDRHARRLVRGAPRRRAPPGLEPRLHRDVVSRTVNPSAGAPALPEPGAALATPRPVPTVRAQRRATTDPRWVRLTLTALALLFLATFVVLPAAVVLREAFSHGARAYAAALVDANALAAVRLTLLTALVAVPLNTAFGLAAAWCVTRYRFAGRGLLVALIDLPFGVSPVISGMMLVLLFGAHGLVGPWLAAHGIRIVFAVP